jgi:hypothetical protein
MAAIASTETESLMWDMGTLLFAGPTDSAGLPPV